MRWSNPTAGLATFQRARGTGLPEASRADIEAFMGDLLARRSPSTAATYRKDLRILVRLA